ncbi:MAG: hypothetical protein CVU69_05700 [Deltaproteobacteria bacterium HGW-Deltaproteobacteria-4]|nr:MAG: hypothetical protein CVU69_05700 [Deltaproteobacteria bacterium HGW-Deltaproteobacteria-4]
MKILLIGIYDANTVSLAPQILAGRAKESPVAADHDIQTCEFSIFSDSVESITACIQDQQPDVVGFSCYIWNYSLIKKITPHLDCTILLGGPQVTGIEKQILQSNPEVDIIVTGEGEQTFLELLEYFSGKKSLQEIPGITTKDLQNPQHKPADLNAIPPLFAGIFEQYPDITWVSFETSRGCPMGCGYCTWGYNREMRYFPLDYVLSELEIILRNPQIREIYLCDSSLLLNKRRAMTILDHIIHSGSDKTIRYEFSPEQLDDEIIERMLQLPASEFNFGIQTINPPALASIGRPFDRKRFEGNFQKFIQAFPAAQITVDLIYGLPDDDIEGYLNSLDYVMTLPSVTRILTNPLIVLPGSRFFRDREKYGIILAEDDSFLLRENSTFTQARMLDARRYSFYVNLLFLNSALKNALLKFAEETQTRPVERMIDFFGTLSFTLVQGDYPYTIPSVKEDFEHRNRVFGTVLNRFPDIIDAFQAYSHHRYDFMLRSYPQFFTGQYHKYIKYAAATGEK